MSLTGVYTERGRKLLSLPVAPDDQLPFINDMLLLARYASSMGLPKIKFAQSQKDRSLHSG